MKKIFNLLKVKLYSFLGLLDNSDLPTVEEPVQPMVVEKPVAKKPGRPKSANPAKKTTKKSSKPTEK